MTDKQKHKKDIKLLELDGKPIIKSIFLCKIIKWYRMAIKL